MPLIGHPHTLPVQPKLEILIRIQFKKNQYNKHNRLLCNQFYIVCFLMYSGYTTQIMSWADETEKNYRNRFSLLLLLMYLCAFFIILFFFLFQAISSHQIRFSIFRNVQCNWIDRATTQWVDNTHKKYNNHTKEMWNCIIYTICE